MNPARQFVDELARIGACLTCDGDRLRLVPTLGQAIPADIIERGRALKPALLELLRGVQSPPSQVGHRADDDAQTAFDERAAVAEYDGGLARTEAEFLAAASVAPLMPGESAEDRERVVVHFANYCDRLRKRPAPGQTRSNGGAA